jgi:hypothetical protein
MTIKASVNKKVWLPFLTDINLMGPPTWRFAEIKKTLIKFFYQIRKLTFQRFLKVSKGPKGPKGFQGFQGFPRVPRFPKVSEGFQGFQGFPRVDFFNFNVNPLQLRPVSLAGFEKEKVALMPYR